MDGNELAGLAVKAERIANDAITAADAGQQQLNRVMVPMVFDALALSVRLAANNPSVEAATHIRTILDAVRRIEELGIVEATLRPAR